MMLRREDPATMVVVPAHKIVKAGTLRKIIAQAGLTVEEFVELVGQGVALTESAQDVVVGGAFARPGVAPYLETVSPRSAFRD